MTNKLKLWQAHETWEEAEAAWDSEAVAAIKFRLVNP
jgi:hypothetical protein